MNLIAAEHSSATVNISVDELILINNALNEVCNGIHIEDWEFATRLGTSRAVGRQLLGELGDLVRSFSN